MIARNDIELLLVVGVQAKEIYGPNLGHLGPILAQNEVFGHLLDLVHSICVILHFMIAGNDI
jgi:hypothetical protein